jgi:uncharacterized protein involved in outer membrane biogenesis
MKLLKRLTIAFAVLLLIAAALPLFISLDDYIPQIEKVASATLKQPVSIKRIDIDSLVLTRTAIDKIPAWVNSDAAKSPQQPPQFRVESIRFNDAWVNLGKTRFGPFDARITLDGKGEPADASISTRDGRLKLQIKPNASNYLIDASAKSWTLPVGPALVFDELIIKGVATPNNAKLGEVSARLYDGTAAGKVAVRWQKGLRLEGNFNINQLQLRQVAPLLSPGTHVSGKLNAKPVFSGVAASADQLINALRLETPFDVQNGALGGVDMHKAATNLIKQETTGGKHGSISCPDISSWSAAATISRNSRSPRARWPRTAM